MIHIEITEFLNKVSLLSKINNQVGWAWPVMTHRRTYTTHTSRIINIINEEIQTPFVPANKKGN